MSDNIIFEEADAADDISDIDIIENQLMLINEVLGMSFNIYDSMDEDRIKVVSTGFKLIHRVQLKLLKEWQSKK